MFLGHQHLLLPGADFSGVDGVDVVKGALHGAPAVMAGFWGSHLGVIDLSLERAGAGWRVAAAKVEARPIYRREGETVTALVEADARVLAAAQGGARRDASLCPLASRRHRFADQFLFRAGRRRSVGADRQRRADLVRRTGSPRPSPALAGLPILSAAAPFKSGGRGGPDYYTDVAAGPIAIKNVADLYLYPNALRAVKIDGATLREWLERSAGLFRASIPDSLAEQPLLDANFAAYNFDVIDGVTYEIDVTQPSRYDSDGKLVAPDAHRIRSLTFRGAPVDPKQAFIVVTNSYRAGGGGNFPGCDGTTTVLEAPDSNRDVMVRYIVETRHVEPKSDGNWRFTPWPPEVVATFSTSPAAARAAPPAGVTLTPMGAAPAASSNIASSRNDASRRGRVNGRGGRRGRDTEYGQNLAPVLIDADRAAGDQAPLRPLGLAHRLDPRRVGDDGAGPHRVGPAQMADAGADAERRQRLAARRGGGALRLAVIDQRPHADARDVPARSAQRAEPRGRAGRVVEMERLRIIGAREGDDRLAGELAGADDGRLADAMVLVEQRDHRAASAAARRRKKIALFCVMTISSFWLTTFEAELDDAERRPRARRARAQGGAARAQAVAGLDRLDPVERLDARLALAGGAIEKFIAVHARQHRRGVPAGGDQLAGERIARRLRGRDGTAADRTGARTRRSPRR